jgi:hypothetical protein
LLNPVDVATLVLRYYEKVAYLAQNDKAPDADRLVVPPSDPFAPQHGSDIEEIPGRRPVGFAHADSPVRLYTFSEVRGALDRFERDDPSAHAVLTAELGDPAFGASLRSEWNHVARIYRDTTEAKRALLELQEGEYTPGELASAQLAYDRQVARGSKALAEVTHRVLDAADALARYLPKKSWN